MAVNKLRQYQFRVLPSSVILKKALRRAVRPFSQWWQNRHCSRSQPYSTAVQLPWHGNHLSSYLVPPPPNALEPYATDLSAITEHCLQQRWYILGCGWITPVHGIPVAGFEGHRYQTEPLPPSMIEGGKWLAQVLPWHAVPRAQWLWHLIEQPHQPFDWQRDFCSGYRWSERQRSATIPLEAAPGADPKVPWELGRLQLLPLLALDAHRRATQEDRMRILRLIEMILLDAAAQNPPGYGIQWRSSMDVAIRLANILVTLDLVRSLGMRPSVEQAMVLWAYDHARFVLNNLEWSEGMRANHYLACVAGLAVAAAYFPDCSWTHQLRRWCAHTLIRETFYQFLPDGGNFEASLAYHRLSAEMVGWAIWLLRQTPEGSALLNQADFDNLLNRIATFTHQMTYQSGIAPQVGDNDSGRFLWLIPYGDDPTLHRAWHGIPTPYYSQRQHRETIALLQATVTNAPDILGAIFSDRLLSPSHAFVAPDFGLAVLRKAPCEVFLRAGSIGQRGKGGHCHNDQLSVTMALEGKELIVDPGTGVYLPSPRQRNYFRSTRQHSTLFYDEMEQNTWSDGSGESLFWLTSDRAKARIIVATSDTIVAEHFAYGFPHRRIIELHEKCLKITDSFANYQDALFFFHLHPAVQVEHAGHTVILCLGQWCVACTSTGAIKLEKGLYSHSYGVWCPTTTLVVIPSGPLNRTEFCWERCTYVCEVTDVSKRHATA